MSVQEATSDVGYCDISDVSSLFEQYAEFDAVSNPGESIVDGMILEWSDYIDRYTGHAWRERRVVHEFHDFDTPYYYWAGKPIKLSKREIATPFDNTKGDKIEIWRGDSYEDMVSSSSYSEGRSGDYWVDGPNGMLFIYQRLIWPRRKGIRVSYRYGHGVGKIEGTNKDMPGGIPRDVKMACTKLVAQDLIDSDQYRITTPGNTDAVDMNTVSQKWWDDAHETLDRRKEVRTYGTAGVL